jgi:hypothetical protein
MKTRLFFLLMIALGIGSAFTASHNLSDQYVQVQTGDFMLKTDALSQELGACIEGGSFCTYIRVSPLVNPSDLNDPANYEQDPSSISERWHDAE